MSWLPIFIDEQDKKFLLHWLDAQEEIAFIVSTGIKQWKAVSTVDDLPNGKYLLWYTPGGPLPRLITEFGEDWIQEEEEEPVLTQWQANNTVGFIDNPWTGWTEECTGADWSVPYFGVAPPHIINLEIHTQYELHAEGRIVEGIFVKERAFYQENTLGLSGFSWAGSDNYYGRLPRHPDEDTWEQAQARTREWWEKLKQWIAAEAKLLAHYPEWWDEGKLIEAWDFYAFPSAHQALKNGMGYVANGFDLTEGIQQS